MSEAPKMRPQYLTLPEPVNDFAIEGSVVLPPKPIITQGKKDKRKFKIALMAVGHRCEVPGPKMDRPVCVNVLAYDDLGKWVLRTIKQGDHVLVRGGFATKFRPGGKIVNLVASTVERVKQPSADAARRMVGA